MRLKDIYTLNKSDRQVLLILVCVIGTSLIGMHFLGQSTDSESSFADSLSMPASQFISQRSETQRQGTSASRYGSSLDTPRPAKHLVPFDPNTADSTTLLGLGLQRWQVRSIYKYRAHGGIYRTKEDFAQLYGLTLGQYRELEPYIRISELFQPASNSVHRESDGRSQYEEGVTVVSEHRRYEKLVAGQTVDLATADTLELRKVPGIGMGFAKSILSLKRRLGGFASTDQLMEISGFPEDALPYFTLSHVSVKRININNLSLDRLRAHPYINFYMARDIVEHRKKYGPISSLSEMSIYTSFSADIIHKLEPYIEY